MTGEHHRTVYPPLDIPKPVAENVWIVDSGPLRAFGLPVPVRMTVVRLASGELWLHSPTRYRAELRQSLKRLGRVGHLVAPSVAHWQFVADWQAQCPNAVTWAAPGLYDRAAVQRAGLRIDAELGPAPPADWAGDLDQVVLRGGFGLVEVAFLHRTSRTLVLTDLVENFEPEKLPAWLRPVVRLAGAMAPDGQAPAHYRFAVNRNRAEAAGAARRIIGWSPERVVFAHGAWFERDGLARLTQSLRWLVA